MNKLLGLMWGSVTGMLGSPWLIAGAFALGLLMGGAGSWRVMSWQEKAAYVEAVDDAVKEDKRRDDVTEKVGADVAQRQEEVRVIYRDIEKKVYVYVTKEDDAKCTISDDFIRVYNAAAIGLPIATESPR